ncbi:cysteine synthase CysM [Sediminitomix flava]|uniref:Cysteine synthase n=1 Tax=Sediminitomix flava TaxID=379075 RepID=A0A315ZIS8_SEDFL|nr:cysteine synthase CysM [Sediminitomix flava]PWJ44604.1 cysteine synthase B [Sediminitomix flava]
MASLLDFVGNTPLVEIKNINPNPKVRLLAKLEGHNPGGSVKDRAAFSMIKGALDRNEIDQHTKLIEPTSGNTGIALAMIARLYNLNIELVMPENSTAERVKTMRAYGAKVTLTPAEGSMETAIDYARQKVEEDGYVMLNQFGNPDNYMAHYRTTGPEIWRDTEGTVTHFVSAMGTTGTIMGTSRFLKEKNNNIQIVGTQPQEGSRIPGIRRWPEAYLPAIFEKERVDQVIDVSQTDAENNARRLAKEEGIFSGVSSGGALTAALKVAEQIEEGTIVFIVCDRGDRYLSSELFS